MIISGRVTLLLRFDAREQRDGFAELVALRESAPVGGCEGGFALPVELGAYGIRFPGDDRDYEDRDDAQGLGERVEDLVEFIGLGAVFG